MYEISLRIFVQPAPLFAFQDARTTSLICILCFDVSFMQHHSVGNTLKPVSRFLLETGNRSLNVKLICMLTAKRWISEKSIALRKPTLSTELFRADQKNNVYIVSL